MAVLLPTLTPTPRLVTSPTPTALPKGSVNAALVNLHNGPNERADIIGQLGPGQRFTIQAASADGKWYQICCPLQAQGQVWIDAQFVKMEKTPDNGTPNVAALPDQTGTPAPATNAPTGTETNSGEVDGVINANLVNLRGGPGTNYPTVGQIGNGTKVKITGRNQEANWLRICCPKGAAAVTWISAQFMDISMPSGATVAGVPLAPIPPTPVAPPGNPGSGQSAAQLAAAPAPGLPGPGGFGPPGATNPLTGLPLPAGRAGQRPIIVCINNDYAARPQFGTSQADVVYEYLMEGYGITRFSGIFFGDSSPRIGPVRSARLINYYMGALYNAGLACSGASDPVRYLLKHQAPFPYLDVDLDDPSNTRYTVSINNDYRTRLRTATDKLHRWLADWGVEQPASIRGFTFGNTPGGGAPANTIGIPYPSGTGCQVNYRYDAGSGRYLRFMGGGPHVDGNTGAQLALDNVIIQYVVHENTNIVEDSLGSKSIRLNLFGSGKAIVFRDGQAFEGTWRSDSRGDTPHFYDRSGAEIPLKPGKSWISVVPSTYTISYQ